MLGRQEYRERVNRCEQEHDEAGEEDRAAGGNRRGAAAELRDLLGDFGLCELRLLVSQGGRLAEQVGEQADQRAARGVGVGGGGSDGLAYLSVRGQSRA